MRKTSGIALSLLVTLFAADALAAPPPSTDVLWAQSQPWIDVPLPAGTRAWSIEVTGLATDCADPVLARREPRPECDGAATAGTAIDVVVHVVEAGSGLEAATPLRCRGGGACRADLVAGSARVLLLVHGGPEAHGRIRGSITVRAGTGVTSYPFAFADNVMLDLGAPPSGGFDLVSVLVPDGPTPDGRPGNQPNDFLGADATEAWLLDANLRLLHADLAHSGVGAAALIRHVESFPAVRWALVRPWSPPPADTTLRPGGRPLPVADGTKAPTVGAGRMRVLVNDVYTGDADGDGVSTRIEQAFETCTGNNNYAGTRACVRIAYLRQYPARSWMDPRDTDGDGISDGAEILGSDVAMGTMPTATGACPAAPAPVPIADADQTFPLWNFDPRHRDALVEIDRAAAGQDTCPTSTSGCAADGSAIDFSWDLVSWHARYVDLEASRANNPDQRPGIELHFDARLATVATMGHGMRPEISLRDATGTVRPGLVIYRPDLGGSTCSCNGTTNCADPRHGGYGRYAQYYNPGGGGSSNCNSMINYGRNGGGLAAAHEMGHHLGLQHGGPTNCFGNPFGFDAEVSPEIVLPNKMIFVSAMSYLYTYDPQVPFSLGANSGFTLPRGAPDPGDPLGYPERMTFMGNDVSAVRRNLGFVTAGGTPPSTCPPRTSCTDVDLDRDGSWDDTVRLPVDGVYTLGRDYVTSVANYWCQTEQEPIWGGGCCTQPTTPGAAHQCINGGTPTEPTIARTMLMAGGPATTLANGKWYEFFTDDDITDEDVAPGQVPPRRCGMTAAASTGCTPIGTGPMLGKLRWGRIERWSSASEPRSQTPCRGHGSQCGVGVAKGNVRISGPAGDTALWGNTLIAASMVGSGAAEQTVLAWTSRGSSTTAGFDCTGATCQTAWSPLRVRYAASTAIETTGFAVRGAGDLAFPAGQDARVSGVALVRWNPATGATDRTLVIARQALTDQLWWGTCDASGCGVARPLSAGGAVVTSNGPIAAAAENLASSPRLAIAYTDATNRVQLLVATPGGGAGLAPVQRTLAKVPGGGGLFGVDETALSIAFTEPSENRLMLYYEAGAPTTFITTGRASSLNDPGAIAMSYEVTNPWDSTRVSHRVDASGNAVMPAGPGTIPALIYDGRTGVTDDPRIAGLEQRVRVFMSVVGQGHLANQSVTTADGLPDVAFHDYDEISAMSWSLCPTVAASGLGVATPDLDLSRTGTPAFRCPSAVDWHQGILDPRLREIVACRWAGGRCLPFIDRRDWVINPADLVSQYLVRPERFAVVQPAVVKERLVSTLPAHGLPICSAELPAAAAMQLPVLDEKEALRRLPRHLFQVMEQLQLQHQIGLERSIKTLDTLRVDGRP